MARTGATALEATVTPGNRASHRLFAAFADAHGATLRTSPLFVTEDFPDDHDPEDLLQHRSALRTQRLPPGPPGRRSWPVPHGPPGPPVSDVTGRVTEISQMGRTGPGAGYRGRDN